MQPTFEQDSSTECLFKWAESLGIWLNPKLRYPVRFPAGYIGIQTTDVIEPGERILSATNQAMLSTKFVNHPALEQLYKAHPSLFLIPDKAHEDNRFLTYFLWEYSKGSSSFWFTYFEYLPKDLETIVDWTDDELQVLQDPDLISHTKRKRSKDFNNYSSLRTAYLKFPNLFCEDDVSIAQIHWAWKIICTRSYSGKIPYSTLIPIADLFNHNNVNTNYFYGTEQEESPDADDLALEINQNDDDDPINDPEKVVQLSNLKLYRLSLGPPGKFNEKQMAKNNEILKEAKTLDQKVFVQKMTSATKGINNSGVGESDTHRFRMTCSKFERFEAGAEVFIKYGNYSNRQLLLHYGFAMQGNVYNYARIKKRLAELLDDRQRQVLSGGYSLDDTVIFKVKENEFCADIVKAFRGFFWNIDEHEPDGFLNPKDLQLEIKALDRALDLLQESIAQFETTVEQDLEILAKAEYKNYFAVTYRIGVKRCIGRQIELVKGVREIMERIRNGVLDYDGRWYGEQDCDIDRNRQAIKSYIECIKKYMI